MYKINDMPEQVSAELLARAELAETATIGHTEYMGFADPNIRPQSGINGPIVGTAVTLALPALDSTLLHQAASLVRPGDILVIDRLGDRKFSCVGGGVALALKRTGLSAAVIDGPVTDPQELREFEFPVWARGISNITTRILDIWGAMNVPISCGGAVVLPGDLVICDEAGVLFLRRDEAPAIIEKAIGMQDYERSIHAQLGKSLVLGELSGANKLIEDKMRKDN